MVSTKGATLSIKKKGKSIQKQLKGAGRKARDAEMEEKVFELICELHSRNLLLTR